MSQGSHPSTGTPASDALRSVGTLLLLVRALDQHLRVLTGAEASTLADLGVLGQIERGVDLPSLVARTLRLDPARVTHITDRLAAGGQITREVDPQDRRRWRLQITPQGHDRLERGREDLRAVMETLLSELTAEERVALVSGLEGVRRVLDTQAAPRDDGAPSLARV